jgi:hypothetical protein
MQSLENRRRDRAGRKAAEQGLVDLSPEAALVAAELADKNGDPFGLGGIGKIDLMAYLVKG